MFRINEAIKNGENFFSFNEDEQRLVYKFKDDLQEEYNRLWDTVFPNINLDPTTPQGQIITSSIQDDLATISFMENMGNSYFFGGSGQDLDLWAWNLFRVTRKKAKPASVNITITGVPNTEIPNDFLIGDGTNTFKITESTVIPASGEISALFQNVEVSEFIAPANTINKLITIIDGVETVNNPNQSIPAVLEESDSEMFNRCYTFGATATNGSFRSILAKVAQVDGVIKITGAENFTGNPKEFNGLTLPPHSICIVVVGASDEDIALAIQDSRCTGCDMLGNTEVEIYDYNQTYEYKFYRPTEVPFKVRIEASINIDSPTNWEDTLKDNIVSYFKDLDIAQLITQPQISNHLFRSVEGFSIVDVQFAKKDEDLDYAKVQLLLNEVATIDRNDIVVVKI